MTNSIDKPKSRRGFAAMDPAKRSAIARLGGAAVPAEKRAFTKDRALAVASGRRGGQTKKSGVALKSSNQP